MFASKSILCLTLLQFIILCPCLLVQGANITIFQKYILSQDAVAITQTFPGMAGVTACINLCQLTRGREPCSAISFEQGICEFIYVKEFKEVNQTGKEVFLSQGKCDSTFVWQVGQKRC